MARLVYALVGAYLGGGFMVIPALVSWFVFLSLPWNTLINEGPFDRMDRCSTISITMFGMGVFAGVVLGWRAGGETRQNFATRTQPEAASHAIRGDLPGK
jgi:hypothetical protein